MKEIDRFICRYWSFMGISKRSIHTVQYLLKEYKLLHKYPDLYLFLLSYQDYWVRINANQIIILDVIKGEEIR